MIPVLGSAQARAFDRFLAERCAVPSLLLMENAGRGAARIIHERLGQSGRRVLCACGPGNNGGDGLVVVRQLLALGQRPFVALVGGSGELAPDARVNLAAWRGLGGLVHEVGEDGAARARFDALCREADAVVDALLGTGLSRELSGRYRAGVESINASGLPVFALDIPSGLSADSGEVLGCVIRARATISFGHPKTGLLTSSASDAVGELLIADLGVPRDVGPAREPRAEWLEALDVAGLIEPRAASAHKGSAGRVVIVAGSVGKTGAALLSSLAALRAGAGLVSICTFPEAMRSLDQRVVEVMTNAIDPTRIEASLDRALAGADVVVIGPGLGLDAAARAAIDHVVLRFAGPKIVDADAISAFEGRAAELARAAGVCLLTPHPGELGRLLGTTAAVVEADRFSALDRALSLTGQHVLLKGPHTLIGRPQKRPWVSSTGTPVLATGGSGDVLSGLCGALAVGRALDRAAAVAAYVHGQAAQSWARAHAGADRGLLAHELLDYVPEVIANLVARRARAAADTNAQA